MFKRIMIIAGMLAFAMLASSQESQNPQNSRDPEDTPITQGAFCVKIVKIMKARLPEGVSEQDAVSFLETLGLKPRQGWNISKMLNERTLGDILVIVAAPNLGTVNPEALVSIVRADMILHRTANLFRKFFLIKGMDDNNTENQIVDEGALTGQSLSPSQSK